MTLTPTAGQQRSLARAAKIGRRQPWARKARRRARIARVRRAFSRR